jgi:hypothetical protein
MPSASRSEDSALHLDHVYAPTDPSRNAACVPHVRAPASRDPDRGCNGWPERVGADESHPHAVNPHTAVLEIKIAGVVEVPHPLSRAS